MERKIEVLSPAGDMEALQFALLYGADAVYLGAKEFGMRSSSANFTMEEMQQAALLAHEAGSKAYLTMNTLPTNEEMDRMPDFVKQAAATGIDAFIVADIGVLSVVKNIAPQMEVHLSTQAGIANYASARMAYDLGAKRVVLARELTLEDIATVRAKVPADLSLEVFVHGAMCMSVSGRCLLSQFMTGRDANRGNCPQNCRWKYTLHEEKRPGESYEIGEGEGGSYILSADDLCAAPLLDKVVEAGADSLKIEGRSKSFYYVASVTAAYRAALDAVLQARKTGTAYTCPAFVQEELTRTSHRPYSTGFFMGKENATQSPRQGGYIREWQVLGVVDEQSDDRIVCIQRGKFVLGEELELLRPHDNPLRFTPSDIRNDKGEQIEATPHTKMKFSIPVPEGEIIPAGSILRKKL